MIDVDSAQLAVQVAQLEAEVLLLKERLRTRDYQEDTVYISSTKPWIVDYQQRKHIFIWLPTSLTLSFEDYGSGPVQGQNWINIAMPAGTRMLAPNNTTLVPVMIRCTDEVIP